MTTAKGRTVLAEFSICYTDMLVSLVPQQAALLPLLLLRYFAFTAWPFRA